VGRAIPEENQFIKTNYYNFNQQYQNQNTPESFARHKGSESRDCSRQVDAITLERKR
jgi:hypothetical protein